MAPRTLLATGLAIVAVCVAGAASAEMYRWVDEQGQIHFTSDESKVPPRYRGQAAEEPTSTGATFNRTESSSEARPEKRKTGEDRLERLRRENRKTVRKEKTATRQSVSDGAAKTPSSGSSPRKYLRDCTQRNANGRCGRMLNPSWKPTPASR